MGCCYNPAVYMADKSNAEDFLIANTPPPGEPDDPATTDVVEGVWALPRILAFELQPQVEELPTFKHSDSDGAKVTVCDECEVTNNVLVDYFQCDNPPMTDFLKVCTEYAFRAFCNTPIGHKDRSFTQANIDGKDASISPVINPFFSMCGKASYGNRRYDCNNPQRVSQVTLQGTSTLKEPEINDDIRGTWEDIYESTPCKPAPTP